MAALHPPPGSDAPEPRPLRSLPEGGENGERHWATPGEWAAAWSGVVRLARQAVESRKSSPVWRRLMDDVETLRLNKGLAERILREVRSDPTSPYAGKVVGI